MRPHYSSSESLKLLEERSLSSEFQPLEELKLQQEELQLAFRKDFPGGIGGKGRSEPERIVGGCNLSVSVKSRDSAGLCPTFLP